MSPVAVVEKIKFGTHLCVTGSMLLVLALLLDSDLIAVTLKVSPEVFVAILLIMDDRELRSTVSVV